MHHMCRELQKQKNYEGVLNLLLQYACPSSDIELQTMDQTLIINIHY